MGCRVRVLLPRRAGAVEPGEGTPAPWTVAFEATAAAPLIPLRHVLIGINAHVNFDLPQALLAVITDDEFHDPAVVAARSEDHQHADEILAGRVPEEDKILWEETDPAASAGSTAR